MLTLFLFILKCSSQTIFGSSINTSLYMSLKDQNCFYDRNYNSRLSYSSPLCLYGCKFQSIRVSSSKGGAVYISYNSVNSQNNHFENCIFSNCLGSEGGALYISTAQFSNTEIYNCTFNNNSATTLGGSILLTNSKFKLFECHFFNNGMNVQNKQIFGGTIYFWTSEGTIKNCKFINNYSRFISTTNTIIDSFGGTIYIYQTDTIFDQCIFNNNTMQTGKISGSSDGYVPSMFGAVISITSSQCNFTNSSFDNNKGISDNSITIGPCEGCSIFTNRSSITNVEFCNFTNNLLYEVGKLNLIHEMSGNGAYFYESNGTFLGCNFINNTSHSYDSKSTNCGIVSRGAAVVMYYSYGSFEKCVFMNNSFVASGYSRFGTPSIYGGAVYAYPFETNYTSCSFINNRANFSGPTIKVGGGAIYTSGGFIEKCCFSDNTALNGGHIYYEQYLFRYYSSRLVVDRCSFTSTHDNNGIMQSLFYIKAVANNSFANSFTNNAVYFVNVEKLLLFNGTISQSRVLNTTSNRYEYVWATLKFYFINNCVSSYNGIIFKNYSFPLLDENGENNVTFELSFDSLCSKTLIDCPFYYIFGPSAESTQSFQFTEPDIFSRTVEYTKSNVINKDTSVKKSKNKNIKKTILLGCITCFEIIVIALVIVLIIVIAKINRKRELVEPLIDDFE